MSFEELSIYLVLALFIIVFYFGAGNEKDHPRLVNRSSQFTIPNFPTYRGKSILEARTTNKPEAEAAIKAIYEGSGLKAPIIIWTQSPLANVFAKTAIDYFNMNDIVIPSNNWFQNKCRQNDKIRTGAWQSVCKAGWSASDVGTGNAVWHNVKIYEYRDDICWGHIPPLTTDALPNGLANMSRNSAWFDIGDIVERKSSTDWLIDLQVQSMVAIRYPGADPHAGDARTYWHTSQNYNGELRHQKNLNCLPPEVPDTDHRHFSYPTDMRSDFQILRDSAGWVMPYQNMCFVSERPQDLRLDESERLHCETGPAMIYPDGFSVHAWHGTVFPEEWIETKPTASEALYLRNVEQRRVACEMIGWETILDELDCVTIDKDKDPEIGELLSVNIPNQGEDKFLRVTCGTGRKFALPVPPEMTTARQANAWTWGLNSHEYRPEVRT